MDIIDREQAWLDQGKGPGRCVTCLQMDQDDGMETLEGEKNEEENFPTPVRRPR